MESEVKKHKYLPALLTVLIMILVTAGVAYGTWYYADQQNQSRQEELQKQIDDLKKKETAPAISPTTTTPAGETANWKVYANNDWGFSFSYPSTYSVVENTVTQPGKSMAGNLAIEDKTRAGKPKLNLLFNPDGLGGCLVDKNDYVYTTAISGEKVDIIKKELQVSSTCPYSATVLTIFGVGKTVFSGEFKNGIYGNYSYLSGNYQAELEQIIGTMKITKLALYGQE